jgi:rubredoxin
MIAVDDLRSCDNCGNVFLKKTGDKMTNRCPACNVWKKEILTQ